MLKVRLLSGELIATVTQWTEYRNANPEVAGSIPAGGLFYYLNGNSIMPAMQAYSMSTHPQTGASCLLVYDEQLQTEMESCSDLVDRVVAEKEHLLDEIDEVFAYLEDTQRNIAKGNAGNMRERNQWMSDLSIIAGKLKTYCDLAIDLSHELQNM